ncbi:MAG: hypothetical protein WCJ35_02115 [Planctomycetota bacterium]
MESMAPASADGDVIRMLRITPAFEALNAIAGCEGAMLRILVCAKLPGFASGNAPSGAVILVRKTSSSSRVGISE